MKLYVPVITHPYLTSILCDRFCLQYKDGVKEKLPKDFFLRNASKARSDTFINTREIMGRFKLKPGRYCIIPSTFEQHQEGDFLIRIYSLKKASSV